MTVSLAGCITDSVDEDVVDEITEIWGCMEESSLNYDSSATNSSGLCLSEEQLLLAEEVFWDSWGTDAVNNATEPIGYLLMLKETSETENVTWGLDIQEVFAPDYYDQKIEYKVGDEYILDDVIETSYYSSQTVFDNLVQVEKFTDGEWENYSMDTSSTYDEFRNRLENGPGIRSSTGYGDNYAISQETDARSETSARSGDGGPGSSDCDDHVVTVRPCGFPSVAGTEFESIDVHEVEFRGSDRAQTIYYFAKDTNTGTEIEVMGEMTEDGFKISEYCNQIPSTDHSIITSYMGVSTDTADSDDDWKPTKISARIILLEMDGNDMRFEEYDYDEPVNSQTGEVVDASYARKAIPFYFDWMSDEGTDETENNSETDESKGLNGVDVKLVIAGSSGAYGMEGDLSEYRLVTSNCTLDNATTGEKATVEADEEETSARSEKGNGTIDPFPPPIDEMAIYGSDGNTCVNIDVYDLSDIDGLLENGITFVDADSSGTLTEGDSFEFSDNYTCDGCDEANMLRLYSTSADEFSDANINPSSEMSLVHQGAMNAIRNVRSIDLDEPAPPVRAQDHNSTRSNRANQKSTFILAF